MKRLILITTILCLLLPLAAGAQQNRERNNNRCSLAGSLPDLPYGELDEQEILDLVYMREEEKVARDVYLSLHEEWEMKIFRQIAKAERTHMRAVLYHLRKYDLDDPAAGNGVGVFSNPDLQEIYDDLVLLGLLSVDDALMVGASVEELDIFDLEVALARTDNIDLQTLYQNLLKGSRNHLRAFHKVLTRRDLVFNPQYLTQDEYDEIVYSPKERGVVDADGEYLCGGEGKRLGAG